MTTEELQQKKKHWGFKNIRGSVHTKRTLMSAELSVLLDTIEGNASASTYIQAIIEDNLLRKQSVSNRKYTASYLIDLYSLNPDILLFRALRYYWEKDPEAHHSLALLCAYARDSLLRKSWEYIKDLREGAQPEKTEMEDYLEIQYPGRFSQKVLQSVTRNLRSSWTQSGHLTGRRPKTRALPSVSAGSLSYALLLGYLTGSRGELLFTSEYVELLDIPPNALLELSHEASRRGYIIFKRLGDVIEVGFPAEVLPEPDKGEWR